MRWDHKSIAARAVSAGVFAATLGVFVPAIAKETQKQVGACLTQYKSLSNYLAKCMSAYSDKVDNLAKGKAHDRAEQLCVQLHPDQFPNGPPKDPFLNSPQNFLMNMSQEDIQRMRAAYFREHKSEYDEYNKERELMATCIGENLRAPIPADYRESREKAGDSLTLCFYILNASDVDRSRVVSVCDGDSCDAFYAIPGKRCISLIGKDMYCALKTQMIAQCVSPSCDAGEFSPTKRCDPFTKFEVKSSSPPKSRQVNQGVGTPNNTSKAKNNLDRFGLGPTYVDTSSAGVPGTSRGAGAKGTAGTGTNMKGTVRQDAPPPPPSWSSQGGGMGASVPTPIK